MEELITLFPALKTYLVYTSTGVCGLVAFSTAFIATARIFVGLTFWTKKDDAILKELEDKYDKLVNGPLKPLFKIFDRFSILKDTIPKK